MYNQSSNLFSIEFGASGEGLQICFCRIRCGPVLEQPVSQDSDGFGQQVLGIGRNRRIFFNFGLIIYQKRDREEEEEEEKTKNQKGREAEKKRRKKRKEEERKGKTKNKKTNVRADPSS
jgi:hypothetical protein